ncbi:MAG: YjbH domain-containing protein [Elusimicrobiota bacterium]
MLHLKKVFCILFLCTLISTVSAATNDTKDIRHYFLNSQNLRGGTGQISNPSARVMQSSKLSFAAHKLESVVTYGVWPGLETGFTIDFSTLTKVDWVRWDSVSQKLKAITLNIKYQLLTERTFAFDVAIGVRGRESYIVASKLFNNIDSSVGFQFCQQDGNIRLLPMISVAAITGYSMFMADYDGLSNKMDLGWRFLLSPKIKFDVLLVDIGHVTDLLFGNLFFGVSLLV